MHDAPLTPPDAPQVTFVRTVHGDDVTDPYRWMADKSDRRLLEYLAAENAFTAAATEHQAALRAAIYGEIAARTKQTDLSVPSFVTHSGGDRWWYFSRTTEGLDYPAHYRLPATSRDETPDLTVVQPTERVLLDVNALAEGHDFLTLGWTEVSPDGRRLAYSIDTSGDERYDLYVLDSTTGELLDGPIVDVAAGGTWVGDDWLFYLRNDAAWRPHEVWRHRVGSTEPDALVFSEPDERFWVWLESSRDDAFAIIEVASKLTGEAHLVPAADPTAPPRCVAPRREGVDYAVEVTPDSLFIVHNADHPQYELATAPLDATSPDHWTTLVAGRDDRRIGGVTAYRTALVVGHRTDGMPGVAVLPRDAAGAVTGEWRELAFDEALHDVSADGDPDYDSDRFRLVYESLVTPPEVLEQRLASDERRLLKRTEVLPHPERGPYRPDHYVSERLWATAADGVQVPLSIVHRADTPIDGTAPALLYGYGAYEASMDPVFSIGRLSLLDRGFVFAIAHVRGGGELGRTWYEQGRGLSKRNTFDDFVAAGRALIEAGYAAPDALVAEGGSAGGLLMGAAINLAPELFRGVHAAVPFVDPLTTILNPELPLTVTEWDEWGDPLHDAEAYAYLKSYSPFENLAAGPFPDLLVTTGLNDTRVEVTEPAKWVARIRDLHPDAGSRVLLKTELVAGHGGVSARYQAWRDRAFELAWMASLVGLDA